MGQEILECIIPKVNGGWVRKACFRWHTYNLQELEDPSRMRITISINKQLGEKETKHVGSPAVPEETNVGGQGNGCQFMHPHEKRQIPGKKGKTWRATPTEEEKKRRGTWTAGKKVVLSFRSGRAQCSQNILQRKSSTNVRFIKSEIVRKTTVPIRKDKKGNTSLNSKKKR